MFGRAIGSAVGQGQMRPQPQGDQFNNAPQGIGPSPNVAQGQMGRMAQGMGQAAGQMFGGPMQKMPMRPPMMGARPNMRPPIPQGTGFVPPQKVGLGPQMPVQQMMGGGEQFNNTPAPGAMGPYLGAGASSPAIGGMQRMRGQMMY